jgi:hypothetical protein
VWGWWGTIWKLQSGWLNFKLGPPKYEATHWNVMLNQDVIQNQFLLKVNLPTKLLRNWLRSLHMMVRISIRAPSTLKYNIKSYTNHMKCNFYEAHSWGNQNTAIKVKLPFMYQFQNKTILKINLVPKEILHYSLLKFCTENVLFNPIIHQYV